MLAPSATTPTPGGTTEKAPSLRAAALGGSAWTLAGYVIGQVLRFGCNLVLTRLLFPEAFGVMALVMVLMQGLEMFSDVGLGPSIVQHARGDDPRFRNTAWTIQVGRGLLLALVGLALSYPFAAFYGRPELVVYVQAAALGAIVTGLQSTSVFTLNRHLASRTLTIVDLTSHVIGATVMILWAVLQPSPWALLVGGISLTATKLLLSHAIQTGPRNRFAWDAAAARDILRLGRWIFLSTILTFCALQADRLVFGKMVPLAMLGVYSIGTMIATLPTQAFNHLGARIAFPVYTHFTRSGAALGPVFRRVRTPMLVVSGFATSSLMACGSPLVEIFYDARYAQAGWIVSLAALGSWFSLLETTNGFGLLALGRAQALLASNATKIVGMGVAIPAGFAMYGFPGAVTGLVVADMAKYAVSAFAARSQGLNAWLSDLGLTGLVMLGAATGWVVVSSLEGVVAPLILVPLATIAAGLSWLVPMRHVWLNLTRRNTKAFP